MKRSAIAALGAAGLGIAVLGSGPTAASSPDTSAQVAPSCYHAAPTVRQSSLSAEVSEGNDVRGNQMTEEVSRAVMRGVKLDESGRPLSGLPYGLETGVVGVVGDATTGLVVVVDPKARPVSNMRSDIAEAVDDQFEEHVDVVESCRSAADLASAWRAVSELGWATKATGPASFYLDTETEQIVVEVESLPSTSLGDALPGVDPSLVRFEGGADYGRLDRFEADPPYYGGSRIKRAITGGTVVCTSGFMVLRNGSNNEAMTTAGHCGPNGGNWTNGPGNAAFGTATARSDYPNYDQELLIGQDYIARIFVDGPGDADANGVRSVTGASDPSTSESVCTSGYVTDARCDWDVVRNDATFCDNPNDPNTCTTFLTRFKKNAVHNPLTDGDSGGPVYTKPGNNAAEIKGMIIAGGTGPGGDLVGFSERYDSIAGHMSVHIATESP